MKYKCSGSIKVIPTKNGPCDRNCYICNHHDNIYNCKKYGIIIYKEFSIDKCGVEIILSIPEFLDLRYRPANNDYWSNHLSGSCSVDYLIKKYFLRYDKNSELYD